MIYTRYGVPCEVVGLTDDPCKVMVKYRSGSAGSERILAYHFSDLKADDGLKEINAARQALIDGVKDKETHPLAGCCAMGLCGPEAAEAARREEAS